MIEPGGASTRARRPLCASQRRVVAPRADQAPNQPTTSQPKQTSTRTPSRPTIPGAEATEEGSRGLQKTHTSAQG